MVKLDEEETFGTDRVGVTYRPKEGTNCMGCSNTRNSSYSINMVDEARDNHEQQIERAEIANLVRSRMDSLNLPPVDYNDVSEKRNSLSYVIINPSCDLKLEEGDIIYLVRPSPFSAQKTFERHNSRRKSNISFCSQTLIQQMAAVANNTGMAGGPLPGSAPCNLQPGSRRGSGLGLSGYQPPVRPPPLVTTKCNSLSLPDSPTVIGAAGGGGGAGYQRGRSNSLRVVDDILLRRSNSLRQGLMHVGTAGRRKSSLEDVGLMHYSATNSGSVFGGGGGGGPGMGSLGQGNPIKIALNGSIGLEVTPPEEASGSPAPLSSNTTILNSSTLSLSHQHQSHHHHHHHGGSHSHGLHHSGGGGGGVGSQIQLGPFCDSPPVSQQTALPPIPTVAGGAQAEPQHLQGTIV